MVGIILTGHGHFATGMESSVKLIAGQPEHFIAVDFPDGDGTDELNRHLSDAVEQLKDCSGVLIFSDLVGGSPFKAAVELKMKSSMPIEVLSGSNLGMIIELTMTRTMVDDLNSLAETAVSTGKEQVMRYVYTEKKEENPTEGI